MRAAIISNGRIEDCTLLASALSKADIVICADGGARHAVKIGIIPDVLIGDLDSINKDTLEGFNKKNIKVLTYPQEKDQTDTQLAVEYAVKIGAKEIILLGCIGSRFDHTLANVSLLIWLLKRGIKGVMIDSNNEIHIMDRYLEIYGEAGEKLSLLPVTPKVKGVVTKGLKYSLNDGELRFETPIGVSNEFVSPRAEIVIKEGILLVIKSRD